MSESNRQQRSRADQRRNQWWVRAVILLVGGFTFLSFLAADPVLRTLRKRDQIGVISQEATATVATYVPAQPSAMPNPLPALVGVRFRGGIHTASTVIRPEAIRLNQTVRIVYRIGHSGSVYIDEVAPMK